MCIRDRYCTQPALSYQIRSLEKELDLARFERSTTRVALTEAGRAFVPVSYTHLDVYKRQCLNW